MSKFPELQTRYPFESGSQMPKSEQGTAEKLSSTISETAGAVKDKAQELVSGVAEQAEKAWDSTREGAEYAARKVQQGASVALDEATDFIRKYPIACVAGALGIGMLLAFATAERS